MAKCEGGGSAETLNEVRVTAADVMRKSLWSGEGECEGDDEKRARGEREREEKSERSCSAARQEMTADLPAATEQRTATLPGFEHLPRLATRTTSRCHVQLFLPQETMMRSPDSKGWGKRRGCRGSGRCYRLTAVGGGQWSEGQPVENCLVATGLLAYHQVNFKQVCNHFEDRRCAPDEIRGTAQ